MGEEGAIGEEIRAQAVEPNLESTKKVVQDGG